MTVGVAEGLSSAIGEEFSKLSGYRSTRTTAVPAVSERQRTGVDNASSIDDGLTITFPDIDDADIAVGMHFRLLSFTRVSITSGVATLSATQNGQRVVLSTGSFAAGVLPGTVLVVSGAEARVNQRVSSTELWLDQPLEREFTGEDWEVFTDLTEEEAIITVVTPGGPPNTVASITLSSPLGADFTDESWEIVSARPTSLDVETTLNWEDAGEVVVASERILYGSKTLTTLDELRPQQHHARGGRIHVVDGATLIDGETFTINDGAGHIVTFEFHKTATELPAADRITLRVDDTLTEAEVRDVVIDGIQRSPLLIEAFAGVLDPIVVLRHQVPGGLGLIDVQDTVADAGFTTQGPYGIDTAFHELTEVVDFSQRYNAVEHYRNNFLVETATGDDLTALARNLGVERPFGLSDAIFRRLVAALAYAPRGTVLALEQVMDAVFGLQNWEMLEDLTLGSFNNPATVFLRRRNEPEIRSTGRAILDGEEARPLTAVSPNAVLTLSQTPLKVIGLRMANEPGSREVNRTTGKDAGEERWGHLVARGDNAFSTDAGKTIELASGTFGTEILPGDIFIAESGLYAGQWLTIYSRDGGGASITTLTTENDLEGATPYPLFDTDFTNVAWKIVRTFSNLRYNHPSDEKAIEYVGGSLKTLWTYTGGVEATEVLLAQNLGALGTGTIMEACGYYQHKLRIDLTSGFEVTLSACVDDETTYTSGANDALQMGLTVKDGTKFIGLGILRATNDYQIGFIDNAGAFLDTPITLTTGVFHTFTIRKAPYEVDPYDTGIVQFLIDGEVRQTVWYDDLSAATNTLNALEFGALPDSVGSTAQLYVKSLMWRVDNHREYWSARSDGSTAAGTPTRLTADAALFAAGDVGRHVRIYRTSAKNAAGGCGDGAWQVASYVSTTAVTLRSPTYGGLSSFRSYPNRVRVGHHDVFAFPRSLGHQLVIVSGPNAGTYTISAVLDAAGNDLADSSPAMFAADVCPETFSNLIELSTDLPYPGLIDNPSWYIVPVFPTDSNVVFELVDAGTLATATMTTRAGYPLPAYVAIGDVVVAELELVDSAHAEDDNPLVVDSGINASSTDGFTISLPAGSMTDSAAHVGMTLILGGDPEDPSTYQRGRIEEINGDDITVAESLGTFSGKIWLVVQEDRNDQFADGEFLKYPFYMYDNFGPIRDVVKAVTAAGVIPDFDRLTRDASYETGVEGLHIYEE